MKNSTHHVLPVYRDGVETLYSACEIALRTKELGALITQDYAGKQLVMVAVLRGAVMFFSDLARAVDLPLHTEFIRLSSYGNDATTSGDPKLVMQLDCDVKNKHVLIVEDIVDTGLSMQRMLAYFAEKKAASVKCATLLVKPCRARVNIDIAYKGFEVPDKFVVGYGLDYQGYLRNLPFVGVMQDNAKALRPPKFEDVDETL